MVKILSVPVSVLALVLLTATAFAQDEELVAEGIDTVESSTVETVQAPSTAAVSGALEIRPSVSTKKMSTENTLDLGIQFNENIYAGYRQGFETGLYDSSTGVTDLNPIITDTILRAKISNIWAANGASLSYEPRLYLPVSTKLQQAGHVTTVRNYVTLSQELTNRISVSVSEIPILHVYNRSGGLSEGNQKANPVLENRIFLVASVSVTQRLSFDFPLMLNSVRNASHAGPDGQLANNSGRLEHFLWVYPELSYTLSPNVTVGAAYYSENLLQYSEGDYQGLNLSQGLEKGVAQLVLRASL